MKKFLPLILFIASILAVGAQNSTPIGQSSNAYSMLIPSQNQVFVNPALNVVGFIHRHNIAIYGGGTTNNGKLRFAISTDGGINWNTELGELNTTYTRPGRYPQAFLHNPSGNTTPTSAFIVWAAPTLNVSTDGQVNGTCQVTTSNPVTTTEAYQFQSTGNYVMGGLCESTNGIFWMVESATLSTNDTVFVDSVNVYKGTFAGSNVTWVKHVSLYAPHNMAFDGKKHFTRPNMAFSPDGQTGYVAFLGDINNCDSTYNPVIYKSTDAGANWSSGTEVIIDNIPSATDSIKQYLFDTGTAIESASEVSCAFDFDMTVDANGNPHIFATLCAVERRDTVGVVTGAKGYVVYSGYPKSAVDIYSTDGGGTWIGHYVAQVNQFRTTVPVSSGTLSIDNYNQISRTVDGTRMFYSWSDTDTLIHQAVTTNEAPNTFIAGFEIATGKQTCWKQISGVSNEDFVITPSMAPYVLEGTNGGPEFTLPIVTQEIPTSDGLAPSNFYYVGKGAKFCDEDFKDPAVLDLSWVVAPSAFVPACYQYTSCFSAGIENEESITFNLYPNPTSDVLNIQILKGENIKSIHIVDGMGRVVKTINPGKMVNGTYTLEVAGLAAGMYTLNMNTSVKTYSKKFTVTK